MEAPFFIRDGASLSASLGAKLADRSRRTGVGCSLNAGMSALTPIAITNQDL
jgi:hypothetical protein